MEYSERIEFLPYLKKVEICDKSKVYLRCMKKIPILIMLDNGRIGYKEIEKEFPIQGVGKLIVGFWDE